MTFDIDDKVTAEDWPHEGYIIEMRTSEAGYIAKVLFPNGFENWYLLEELTKIDDKKKFKRPKLQKETP